MPTHAVTNQAPPLGDLNLYDGDPALRAAVDRCGGSGAHAELSTAGALLGQEDSREQGRLANRHPPEFLSHDAQGRRIDRVEFHPAWHTLLRGIISRGLHADPWIRPRPGAHVARAAAFYMQGQVEAGSLCPTTMTSAALPLILRDDTLADWSATIASHHYDSRDLPVAAKRGALVGMGMTEKQGGSDLRSNTTVARPVGGRDYELTGHKWFFSVPQSDAHLVLAQAPSGLSCFLVPRWRPDGDKNAVLIQRLKDKLGNRSNASAEVEFDHCYGRLLGDEGRGIPQLLDVAALTRVDCVLGSAALLRAALVHALHHAAYRQAFGARLLDQPLMRAVLADLVLESEAAMLLGLRLAQALDQGEAGAALLRLATPVAKFWVCKRAIAAAAEAMEVLGGNGYVETGPLACLYREAPVNSIWEGSGNVMCLDMLRALGKTPAMQAALGAELAPAAGLHPAFDRHLAGLRATLADPAEAETRARRLARDIALALQAALLLQHAPMAVAAAFCASRLDAPAEILGTLPSGLNLAAILARAHYA